MAQTSCVLLTAEDRRIPPAAAVCLIVALAG